MKQNDKLHGFTVTDTRSLPELKGDAYIMRHDSTGLKLMWIDRAEVNKTFCIMFETLPENDTGVFHILEHSVLGGSEKYPVKEPFLELLKSSMNTFLNAFTFPDKTGYPVSSRSEQELLNLMRVYLDAVFHPLILHEPRIFQQEGWHYEVSDAGALSYNGVVYSEMKGALSDPDELTESALMRGLFPDTPYRYNYGGDPARIPDLTYDEFVETHRRFYSPSNAYVILDGNLNIESELEVLEEYLRDLEPGQRLAPPAIQSAVNGGVLELEYELPPEDNAERRTRAAWGFVTGTFEEREKLVAAQVLADTLCGSNQSPLCRAVLEKGLAESVAMRASSDIAQGYMVFDIRNFADADLETIETVVHDELVSLAENGLPREELMASMANLEFRLRERDFNSLPEGIGLCIQVMESWLYGGDPTGRLEVGDLFTTLRAKADSGYFEGLIRELFLDNPHRCKVILRPSADAGEKKRKQEKTRLDEESRNWSGEDWERVRAAEASLREFQEKEDTPEELALLPRLTLADIPTEPERIPTEVIDADGVRFLIHNVTSSGIVYCNLYLDATDLTEDEISELGYISSLLGKLGTKRHTASELSSRIRLLCGSLRFEVKSYGKFSGEYNVFLRASFSSLRENVDEAVRLVIEILTETSFNSRADALDILRQNRIELNKGFITDGHSGALSRVSAQLFPWGVARECAEGLKYYRWLASQENNDDWETAGAKLESLLSRLTVRERLTGSITGNEPDLAADIADRVANSFKGGGSVAGNGTLVPWGARREGVVIPSDVSFAVAGGVSGLAYSGEQLLASRVESLAYLWNMVRVQGGAYGTGLRIRPAGLTFCYSYRDPNPSLSLTTYNAAPDYLRQFAASDPDLTGFIIGAAASSEPLMTPRMKADKGDERYWEGVTHEDLCRYRRELINTSAKNLSEYADTLSSILSGGGTCVFGPREQLDACGDFDNIESI